MQMLVMHDCIYHSTFCDIQTVTVGFDPGLYVIIRPCDLLDITNRMDLTTDMSMIKH